MAVGDTPTRAETIGNLFSGFMTDDPKLIPLVQQLMVAFEQLCTDVERLEQRLFKLEDA